MAKPCWMLTGLLTLAVATVGAAQPPEPYGGMGGGAMGEPMAMATPEFAPAPQTYTTPPFALPPADSPPSPATAGPEASMGEPFVLDDSVELPLDMPLSDFLGYRYSTNSLDWIPAGADDLGMFSVVADHYEKSGVNRGIGLGMAFHFLNGPVQTDMPARVFDFSVGYQFRQRFGPLGLDLAAATMASSDFEGSAREGIRFPGHAVGYLHLRPTVELALGVDYLDRDDIALLPVAGVVLNPNPAMRFELVFPRPRAVLQITTRHRLYLAGELGGGTWAIERAGLGDDLATYRDLRASIGLERLQKEGRRSAIEIGYLFDRRLGYRSAVGNMPLADAAILRLVTRY